MTELTDEQIAEAMTRLMHDTPSPADGGDPITWVNTYLHLGTSMFGDLFIDYCSRMTA